MSFFPLIIYTLLLPFLLNACKIDESPAFVIRGGTQLPASATACFNSCKSANCSGVLFQKEKCFTIDKSNYFGPIIEQNYIEKTCLRNVNQKLLVYEYQNLVLVDQTRSSVKTEDKLKCLESCAKEKTFPCLSVMYYPDSQDCLLNSASSTSAILKSDTGGYPVSFMELHALKESFECSNAYKFVAFDEMEIRGKTQLFDGSSGLQRCISRCRNCDFVVFNEIFSECFLVNYDPTGQVLDFINDEYQILSNACATYKKNCNSRNSLYISFINPDDQLKAQCLEICTMEPECQFAYQSKNLSDCVLSKKKLSLPLVAQRVCADVDDLPDGSAILFDQLGGCMKESGQLVSKDVELHQCMQLCVTHPTKSCESITYTNNRFCYLHDTIVETIPNLENCTVFSLKVITFETGTQKKRPPMGDSKNKIKAKTFASGTLGEIRTIDETKMMVQKSTKRPKQAIADVKIETKCNFGDIIVRAKTNGLENGELYVRNGHSNCSTKIRNDGRAELKIKHNDTSCPMVKKGEILETVIVVTQNIGNSSIISIDDQLFKIRCDYSNQKNTIAITKSMNLRSSTYSPLGPSGKVKIKPMSMELRTKREIINPQSVILGQSLDLVFNTPASMKKRVFVHQCFAVDKNNDEKISLIENGCATNMAKEYVLRGEVQPTKTGFILPFRAFRFKQGESVKIECEVKYCEHCSKPICGNRNRRNAVEIVGEIDEIHAELLVKTFEPDFCIGVQKFAIIALIISILISVQLVILIYFCLRFFYSTKKTF